MNCAYFQPLLFAGDRKWETIDGRREVDSELLRTLVCDSVLKVVKDAMSQHQNQRTVSTPRQVRQANHITTCIGGLKQLAV